MPRYIFVSFIMMGWAFYELSGGADFQPTVRATSIVAEAPKQQTTPKNSIRKAQEARARDSVTLASASALPARKTPFVSQNTVADLPVHAAEASNEAHVETVVFPSGTETVIGLSKYQTTPRQEDETAALQNISASPEPVQVIAEPEVRVPVADTADMREIVATRVNLREGPSTNSDIIARLARGHTVEVLGSDGKGWLRLRALPENREGWMAERLVSPAN